jgi:hypothetical protein
LVDTPSDVAVVVPGDWWLVPLTDPEAMRRAVRGLVDRQFDGVDDQPLLKHDLRQRLSVAGGRAAAANGRLMAVSIGKVGAVPLSATMTSYWIPLGRPVGGSHLDDLTTNLLDIDAESVDARYDKAGFDAGPALRRVRRSTNDDETLTQEPTELLLVDYWIEQPGDAGLAQLTFSTPMVMWEEPLLALFDAIAGTAHWQYDPNRK